MSPATSVFDEIDEGVGVFLVALGVPAGFLMNQIYYYIWDGMAVRVSWAPVPRDRGQAILLEMDDRYRRSLAVAGLQIDLEERIELSSRRFKWLDAVLGPRYRVKEIPGVPMADARATYRSARKKNWRAVRWLMLFDLDEETSAVLRAEYGGRADAYHALGGSRYAVITATALCVVYNLAVHFDRAVDEIGRTVALGVIWAVIAFGAYWLLTRGRAATYFVMLEVVRDALRASSRKREPPIAIG
jgi:hypothetical protein